MVDQDLHDALDSIIRRRLLKLQGLKAYLKHAMPCQWGFSAGRMVTVPQEMDSDTYRSPTTRLTAQQSIVVGKGLQFLSRSLCLSSP